MRDRLLDALNPLFFKTIRPLGYERVYLPLYEVADTPFHIQGAKLFQFKTQLQDLWSFNVKAYITLKYFLKLCNLFSFFSVGIAIAIK